MNSEIDELLKGTNYARNFGSKGKVQDENGICSTLQAAMGLGGGNIPIVKESFMDNLKINVIGNYSPSGHDASRIVDENGLAPTVKENHGTVTAIVEHNTDCIIREEPLDIKGWHRNAKEVLNIDGISRTLSTQSNNLVTKIKEKRTMRIRKLTPKECWRLMGFDDADFEKAEKVNSNTQLYKQAGNSIVVDVLENIFLSLKACNLI